MVSLELDQLDWFSLAKLKEVRAAPVRVESPSELSKKGQNTEWKKA